MIKISYDHLFLSTYGTVMVGSIQKFRWAWRTQNSTQSRLVFIVLTFEKNIKCFLWKNRTADWETKLFLSKKKSQQLQYNQLLPDRSCDKLGVHLSLKQILHFFMRKKEVSPMECDCPIPFGALLYMVTESVINN